MDSSLYTIDIGTGIRALGDGKFGFGTSQPGNPASDSYGSGSVDKFFIFDRELSNADVTNVYNQQV